MTRTEAPVHFDGCRERVDELVETHADMGVVERTIDTYALGREEKDALWLWASGRRDRLATHGDRPQPVIPGGDGDDRVG